MILDCSAAVWTSTQIVVGRKKLQQIQRAMLDWIKLLLVASLQIWWITTYTFLPRTNRSQGTMVDQLQSLHT
jgi:hypothetical protein